MIKRRKSLMMIITILLSMVFVVNLGYTFALTETENLIINGKASESSTEMSNYLNDVVVNNSTSLIPIPYTNGTVAREISFDYGFSDNTDYAVEYNLKYVDNSGNTSSTAVDNVQLNFVERDNYLFDSKNVISASNNQYDNLSNYGTLYYMGYIPAGTGNKKLINSVTFIPKNNEVSTYSAIEDVSLYSTSYLVGDEFTVAEFDYVKQDIARYWKVETYSNGVTTITADEYDALTLAEKQEYSINTYATKQYYTIAGTNVSATAVSVSSYKDYVKACESYYTVGYKCFKTVASYAIGDKISESSYATLDESSQQCFNKTYTCNSAYTVVGANSSTISAGTTITVEEFADLFVLEQQYFEPNSYKSYKGENLVIEIKVHTKLNSSSTNQLATDYYNDKHYFKNFSNSNNDRIFNIWLNYKKNTIVDQEGNVSSSVSSEEVVIYNAHGDFESGIPYAYDFSSSKDIKTVTKNSNITTSYLYSQDGKFYALAGGNKSHAGVGVYYLTNNQTGLRVSVGLSWYNANGEKQSSLITISNTELEYNDDFTISTNNYYGYNKLLKANSYGYIDVLEYIRITTIYEQISMVGNKLVITSISAELTNNYTGDWNPTDSRPTAYLDAINSTENNPVLFTSVAHIGYTSTLDLNVSIVNETDVPMLVNSLTITPRFYAYNGQTSSDFLSTKEMFLQFGSASSNGTRFLYNDDTLSMSSSSSTNGNSQTYYTYTFSSSGIYIAPRTALTVISGAVINGSDMTVNDWNITLNNTEYQADYWFEVATSSVNYTEATSTAVTGKTATSSYELMTNLINNEISAGTTSYIAMRNNTSQIMTNVTFTGTLKHTQDWTIKFNYYNYATSPTSVISKDSSSANASTKNTTITISFTGINLRPGESLILCKIVAQTGTNNFYLTDNYELNATLSNIPTVNGTKYLIRDFASGNLSVVNATDADTTLSLAISQIGSNTALTDASKLNGGTTKWSYASSKFKYTSSTITDGTLTKIRAGQLLNVINNYYDADLSAVIST